MKLRNKKGIMRGITYIFSVFGIAFMLIIFYVWVQKDITGAAKEQAEIAASETELRIFFSELIKTHGDTIPISSDDEQIIEQFARKQTTIDKGDYDADCSTEGIDKACTLTITLHETLSTALDWSYFVPGIGPTIWAGNMMVKLIGLNIIQETEQTAYLPVKPDKATRFTLTTKVRFA